MTTDTRELFERYHACWADRDPDRIAELHTADSLLHLHSGQEPAHGRAAIRETAAALLALVPDLTFHLVSLRVGEDFWVVQWELTGTSRDRQSVPCRSCGLCSGRGWCGQSEALLCRWSRDASSAGGRPVIPSYSERYAEGWAARRPTPRILSASPGRRPIMLGP
ncbi:nuclear transport factor 2 family protein [Nocardia sp. Marseille-Q1738]